MLHQDKTDAAFFSIYNNGYRPKGRLFMLKNYLSAIK